MSSGAGFRHYHVNIRAVIKWIYDNKVERIRIRDLSGGPGRGTNNPSYLEGKPKPPTLEISDSFQLASFLISRGLAEPYVSDRSVEYLDFKFVENDRAWRKLRGHWGILNRLKDAAVWVGLNIWLIGLWVATVALSRLIGNFFDP
ncbi:hypothetical protein [Rhizobium leguminosarum]|uniref:hypothetical protein n=1 Tax=Rhizobium leguminosarum TaxID=384 RepID=UPI001F257F20|nr:hypothetical protein [Rhizobium leguminosarum]UIJ80123.1 hypothetical protein LZK78_01900 [Rhizobium leguminosarum]